MTQLTIQQAFDLAVQHHQAGRLAEAEQIYRQILAQQPTHADSTHNLGVLAHQVGRNDLALDLFRRAVALNPNFAEAYNSLGNALKEGGRFDEAVDAYRRAIALRPNYAEAYNNLGNARKDQGQFDEAAAAYGLAIALGPNYAEAYYNLGTVLKEQGQLDEAVATYRRAIALNPNLPEAHSNLASVLKDQGQLDEAIAAYRRAIAIRPTYIETYSNLILTLCLHPSYDAQVIAEEHRRWNRQHAEPLRKFIQPHANDRSPGRRLRVGYISAAFCAHTSAHFLVPLLEHHDRQQMELFCYAQVSRPDARTRRFQQNADGWRNIVGLSDEELTQQIRHDRIDILVDLELHSANNRLLVFARKPAPVQVTWLGYPGSTGLSAIDYRLSDPYLDPPGRDESVYSERTIRLPDSFWCYDPLDGREISVNSLPALEAGIVTFGCLNKFCKINDGVLSLSARVLKQVEHSRLILLARQGSYRQRILDRLQREGIDAARVELVSFQPRQKYLEMYHRIDLGLDCFPYNGHTTSLDSFWMGVPVVTLVGQTAVARGGWCQLSNLGLGELAGQTPEQFVRIAVELARDLPKLSELRQTLRGRMERSPLMNAPKFARNVEAAYRRMWQTWCETASVKS